MVNLWKYDVDKVKAVEGVWSPFEEDSEVKIGRLE